MAEFPARRNQPAGRWAAAQAQGDERLQLFVRALTLDHPFCLLDERGRIVGWSCAAQDLLGYLPDEIIGMHVACLSSLEDDMAGKPYLALECARRHGAFHERAWRMHRTGVRCELAVSLHALAREGAAPAGFIVTFRQIADAAPRKPATAAADIVTLTGEELQEGRNGLRPAEPDFEPRGFAGQPAGTRAVAGGATPTAVARALAPETLSATG